MEMMMTSSQDSGPSWDTYSADHGEAAAGGGVDGGGAAGFLEMFGDPYYSPGSGDLFELVRQGAAGPAAQSYTTTEMRGGGASISFPSPPPPPSEDEMAAWFYAAIVSSDGDVAGRAISIEDDQLAPTAAEEAKAEVKRTHDKVSNCSDRGKQRGGRKSHSHYAETHNLTEKRRRRKINEKFKTLQQLVPGCDKCNQISTLEETIKYTKSLQHQIQAMSSFGSCRIKPASAAVYPVVPPPYYLPTPPASVAGLLAIPPAPAAFAPGVLMRGHVWPGVVLGPPPPPAMFAATLPLLPHHHAVMAPSVGAHAAGSAAAATQWQQQQ